MENNSTEPETFAYYKELEAGHENVRVVYYEGGFNYSKINNFGAAACRGDYFLLLNNAEYQKLDERKDPLLNQAERSFVLTDSNGTTYQVLVFAKNIF